MAQTDIAKKQTAAVALQEAAESAVALDAFGGGKLTIVEQMSIADAVQKIGDALEIPENKERIQALQGTASGFITDQDKPTKRNPNPKPYGWDVVKDCVTEAIMRGIPIVGNCMNILAKRCYATKGCFEFKLREKGVKFTAAATAPPVFNGSDATVSMRVTGSYDGQTINEAVTFAVPNVYAGSIDQAIGKAERRAYKWLYERLTNCHIPDGDADDAVDVQATVSDAPQPAANTANMLAALAEKDISEDDLTDYCRRTGRVEPDEEWTDASQEFLAYAHERPEALAAKILENGAKA